MSGAAGRREVLESDATAVLLRHTAAGDKVTARALVHLSLDGDDTLVPRRPRASPPWTSTSAPSGRTPLDIPALTTLLRRGGPRERREVATTLYELYKLPENRRCASTLCRCSPTPCRRLPTWPPPVLSGPLRCLAFSRRIARGARSLKGYRIPSPPSCALRSFAIMKERGDKHRAFR